MKKFFTAFIISLFVIPAVCMPVFSAGGTIVTYTIDPEKNAYFHNNKGVEYMKEKCYYAAIQEFKIAISLNPKTQATAVYLTNLGKAYNTIGYPQLALQCFEDALIQYSLNLEYYQNLADCFEQLGLVQSELSEYKQTSTKNPAAKIMTALLEEKSGNKKKAVMLLDEFANSEPDLSITPAVKQYIKNLVNEMNK